jgi:hypothetical protein
MLRFAIAFALMRARKLVRGTPSGLSEEERYAVADDVVHRFCRNCRKSLEVSKRYSTPPMDNY